MMRDVIATIISVINFHCQRINLNLQLAWQYTGFHRIHSLLLFCQVFGWSRLGNQQSPASSNKMKIYIIVSKGRSNFSFTLPNGGWVSKNAVRLIYWAAYVVKCTSSQLWNKWYSSFYIWTGWDIYTLLKIFTRYWRADAHDRSA